jgi:flavin reductase (DIM6/NTAB) family NADH-FMN oxidoreductase RutF
VLAAGQQAVAETFSGSDKHGGAYLFHNDDWDGDRTKSPVLKGAIASFDCDVESMVDAATHCIFIGHVNETSSRADTPLLYTCRQYGKPSARNRFNSGFFAGTKNVLERFCA